MLFNSYQFLFAFFPLTLALFALLRRFRGRVHHVVLLVASLVFYAWWDIRFVPLLVGSFAVNFIAGGRIFAWVERGRIRAANLALAAAVVLNLGILGVFKYAHFFVANLDFVTGSDFLLGAIILPLGISFFTFEQIGFLVDIRRGHTHPSDPLSYALFVAFFPRLVAGPILRFSEIAPQLHERRPGPMWDDLAVGLTLFFIGLVKKTVLADGIAPYATTVFTASATGSPQDFLSAWGGVLAYTCQIYFDFSGYSDMAIGLARCFGIRFPMNFYSPYKSASIVEFWRRWHISLSRFLRDYLYISLGGNRHGRVRRYGNLLTTMLLGGLWHGANWTFVFWGGLHGLYLVINHAWVRLADTYLPARKFRGAPVFKPLACAVTFVAVVVAWVFFRAPTLAAASNMLRGMAGFNGIMLPEGLHFALKPFDGVLSAIGVRFTYESGGALVGTYLWVCSLLLIAFVAPATQELLARYDPVLEVADIRLSNPKSARPFFDLRWSPSRPWAIATGIFAFVGILSITRASEFLYWQF